MDRESDSLYEPLETEVIESSTDLMSPGERVDPRNVLLGGFNLHTLWYGGEPQASLADPEAMRQYFQSH